MKFIRKGEIKPDFLEQLVEINPYEKARDLILKRLDYLLKFIGARYPDNLSAYVEKLIERYLELIESINPQMSIKDMKQIPTDMEELHRHPDLAKTFLSYCLSVLRIPDMDQKTIKVTNRNNLRFFLLPRYYNLLVLTDIFGREEGISLYKQFFTHYLMDNRDPDRDRLDSVETLYERATRPEREPSEWVTVRGMIAEGKYAFRNDNCLWVEALVDLPDPELKYYVCCYGDYEGARIHHESIIMTMEHTIAQGDPYCSRVLHDTRVDWDLRHPPKEFWDNIEVE